MTQYTASLTDNIGVAPTDLAQISITLFETIPLTDYPTMPDKLGVSDGIGITPLVLPDKRVNLSLSDAIGIAPTAAQTIGKVIAEAFGISSAQAVTGRYGLLLAQSVGVADRVLAGQPITVAEHIGLALAQQLSAGVRVIERLGLTELLTGRASYGLTVNDSIRLADALRRFFGGSIAEVIGIHETFDLNRRSSGSLSEAIGIGETPNAKLVLRIDVDDQIGIDDIDLPNLIYNGLISENFQIHAAFVQPGGSITTWTVNTRTGATTEYKNYNFTSFVQIGDCYVGGTPDGLYELNGDMDDVRDIIPRIKSGFMQFGNSRFSRLKEAYIGARGHEQFVLKILTGDGKEYHYQANVKDMQTTKVNMGKGQRARYFAFELIGSGLDFDLDTIEFVPIVLQRHV